MHLSSFPCISFCSIASTPSYKPSYTFTVTSLNKKASNPLTSFIPTMEGFSTTTVATTASLISHSQQNMGHPQNVIFSDNSEPLRLNPTTPSPSQLCVPQPYFVPYDQNLGSLYMHMNQPFGGYPMYSIPMGQSSVIIPNHQHQGWSQSREENMKMNEALMAKIARLRRKQARRRSRNSSTPRVPSIPEGTIKGQPLKDTHVFYAPDGKMLTKILTKWLKNSDVSTVGRIVIPKREAEEMLPTLHDKEGINVLLQDVYSDLQWRFKYKYWSNNKSSRMYVLENTVDFVNHYELRVGDSITLYKDEFKNLYVSTKKEQNLEESGYSSSIQGPKTHGTHNYNDMQTIYCTNQATGDEEQASMALLINELRHNKEEKIANNILTIYNGGGSSNLIN